MASKTWTDTSGDWNVGTLWNGGTAPGTADTAIFNSTSFYFATVGTSTTARESDLVAAVTLNDAGATLEIMQGSTLSTGGTGAGTFSLLAGELELNGVLTGGAIQGGGGDIVFEGGTLNHETIVGTVSAYAGFPGTLVVIGGLSFQSTASGPSTLAVNSGELQFLDSETLTGGVIALNDGTLFAGVVAPATLGSNFTLDVTSFATLAGSFVNQGTISVGQFDELFVTPAELSNSGVIDLQSDAVLEVGSITTAVLLPFASGVVFNQGAVIEVVGSLNNTGGTLNYATGTLASKLQLSEAEIVNGVIVSAGSVASPPDFGTLSGVTYEGVLDVANFDIGIVNGLTLEGAGGSGPGTIALGSFGVLDFLDSETLTNATVTASASGHDTIEGPAAGSLTLGSQLTVQVGNAEITFSVGAGATLVNDATITVGKGGIADFAFSGANFVDAGAITVASGGIVEIGSSTSTLTGVQLLADIAAIQGAGTIEVLGTVITPGVLSFTSPVILDADLIGVTVVNSGSVTVAGGTLDGVTFQGPVNFGTSSFEQVTIRDQLTLVAGAGTLGAGITMAGLGDTLNLVGAETFTNGVLAMTGGSDTVFAGATVVTFGSAFAIDVTGSEAISAATIVNAGLIAALGTASTINLETATLVNNGSIVVPTGDALTLGFDSSGSLALSGTGAIALAPGSTLELGGTATTVQLDTLISAATGISFLLEGTLVNNGAVTVSNPGAIRSLQIEADVIGGTIINGAGGTVLVGNGSVATLDGVTFEGPLSAGTVSGSLIEIKDGLTLQSAGGGPGGTIDLLGPDQTINILDAETLSGAVINVSGISDRIASPATIDLANNVTANVSGSLILTTTTLVNAASIAVAAGAVLDLDSSTIFNSGSIGVAKGGVLEVAVGAAGSLSLSDTGPIVLAAGSTLIVGGTETTVQLDTLISGATGISVLLEGTLFNNGTVTVSNPGAISSLQILGDVIGGTIINGAGGTVLVGNGSFATLDGVTFDGPLSAGTVSGSLIEIKDGLTLQSAGGGPGGTIDLLGPNQTVDILDVETLNGAIIDVAGSNARIESGATLDLGSNVVASVSSSLILAAPTVVNAANIAVAAGASLNLDSSTIVNSGSIGVAAGGILEVAFDAAGILSLSDTGAIVLAPDSTVIVAGTATPGNVLTLLNNQPGVTVELVGELSNNGSFVTGVGPLTNVILNGADIVGGVLVASSDLTLDGFNTFTDVTVQGPVTLAAEGDQLEITGGATFENAQGALGGSLALTGEFDTVDVFDGETLDHVTVAASGQSDEIFSATGTLSFGLNFTLAASGVSDVVSGNSIGNAGTLAATGTSGSLLLETATIVNPGIISAGSGDVIGIGIDVSGQTLSLTTGGVVHSGGGSNAFALNLASGATLELGAIAFTSQLIGLLPTNTPGIAVDEIGTLLNTGTVLATGTTLADLVFDNAAVIGGIIANRGGTLLFEGDDSLSTVTFEGALNLSDAEISISNGLSLTGSAGTGFGTINVQSGFGELYFSDSETLANVVVNDPGVFDLIAATPTLTLAASATVNVADQLVIEGTTVVNAGTIIAAGSGELVTIEAASIFNSGTSAVGAGGTLYLDDVYAAALTVANTGSISVAAGGTLIVSGTETTAQLEALVGSIAPQGVEIEILGTLINNAGLTIASTGSLSNVVLDADVIGGDIDYTGGSLLVAGGIFDGVTFQGPLNLSQNGVVLQVRDGLTLQTATGGVGGTVNVTGKSDELIIQDGTTLDAATVNVAFAATSFEILNNGTATLTLGPGLTIDTAARVTLVDSADDTIASGATINVAASNSAGVSFNADTILNSGTISVGAGGGLGLDPFGHGTLDLFNTGLITLAVGSTLTLGGDETTAQMVALVDSISQPGVTLALDGSLANAGTVLILAPGVLGNVVLSDVAIGGGTVLNAGGIIGFGEVALQTVTWQGPLDVASNNAALTVTGSLTVETGIGGEPGFMTLAGFDDSLEFSGTQTFDNVNLLVTSTDYIYHEDTTLTLGPGVSLTVAGGTLTDEGFGGELISNAAIAVSGSLASLTLSDPTVVNGGIITVGAGAILGLDLAASSSASLPFFNTGTGGVTLAAGATIEVGGTETDSQLLALLGSLSNPAVVVDLAFGTLENAGSVLTATPDTLLSTVELDDTVIGGTIADGSGSLTVLGGTFNAVTYQGPLTLAGSFSFLDIVNGITLEGPGGSGPGALDVTGPDVTVDFLDASDTLSAAAVSFTGAHDVLGFETLTLASGLSFSDQSVTELSGFDLVNDTSINMAGTSSALEIVVDGFTNNGIVNVGSGDLLDLEDTDVAPFSLTGTGAIALAPGATLEIGGASTTAQLLALVGSIVGTQPGVAVEFDGQINNAGTTIAIEPTGSLSDVILDANISYGTIADNNGGSLFVIGGAFGSLEFDGVLGLAGSSERLTVAGGLDIKTVGTVGTLNLTGFDNVITLSTPTLVGYATLETLSNLIIEGGGTEFGIGAPEAGTLGIAASVTSFATGSFGFAATTISNAGTFLETTPGARVTFQADDFINTGTIIVAAGAGLGLSSADPTGTITNLVGSIIIASGATLGLGGTLTTAALGTLVGLAVTAPDVTIAYGEGTLVTVPSLLHTYNGELVNAGSVFLIPTTGSLSNIIFDQAEVDGGAIVNDGTVNFQQNSQFDGVTYTGGITLAYASTSVDFEGASTITSGSAAQDVISLLGSFDELEFSPSDVLTSAQLTQPVVGTQELDNALILISSAGTVGDTIGIGGGTVILGATTTLEATGSANITLDADDSGNSTLVNEGTIAVAGSLFVYGDPSFNTGTTGTLINTGLITATGTSTMLVENTAFINTGLVRLAGGETLDFTAPPAQAGNILLVDEAETVRVDSAGLFTATLVNFAAGDTIDLHTLTPGTGTLEFGNGLLDVLQGSVTVAAISLPSYAYGATDFTIATDAAGTGSAITTSQVGTIACFHAGTRIRTTDGEVAVEDLAVGAEVLTVSGTTREVVWIGQRRLDCVRHPRADLVQPIVVRAGAFGAGLPARDLVLSPDHSLYIDGVLIPVHHLLNGATIVRRQVATAHYFHVGLSAHDVLFAEGLPAESYLDTGNRAAFANGAAHLALHPDFFPLGWENACAPLCQSGPIVAATRARLRARARALGYRRARTTAPVLLAGGRLVRASAIKGEVHRYLLPANTAHVTIISASGVPAGLRDGVEDARALGIAIAGIVAHGKPVDLDGENLVSGFHAPEHRDGLTRRWTDGHAELDLPTSAVPGVLEIRVVDAMPGWHKTEVRVSATCGIP